MQMNLVPYTDSIQRLRRLTENLILVSCWLGGENTHQYIRYEITSPVSERAVVGCAPTCGPFNAGEPKIEDFMVLYE
jgi:hypothetical protein